MQSQCVAIAYETVTAADGSLPLLMPMSEVAGRMSIQVGAHYLQQGNGGRGVLLGGVPGVTPAKVVVIGAGVAGTNAIEMAHGLRADVTAIDRSIRRLRELDRAVPWRRTYAVFDRGYDRARRRRRRSGDRRGAAARRGRPQGRDRRDDQAHAARIGGGRHCHRPGRLLSDQSDPPPMRRRSTWSTASSTIASPTCPALCRVLPRSRSTTRPCPTSRRWRTKAGSAPRRKMPDWPPA